MVEVIQYGEGPWKPIVTPSIEATKDRIGNTHVNLHRRLDINFTEAQRQHGVKEAQVEMERVPGHSIITTGEKVPRTYEVGVYGVFSKRYTEICFHDENSQTEETP